MKNYPEALADLDVLRNVLSILYTRAEDEAAEAADYRRRATEEGCDPDSYYFSQAAEHEATSAACLRLVKRLEK